jgi:hypothetical protein
LETAAETGLIGLLIFGAIVASGIAAGVRAVHGFAQKGWPQDCRLVVSLLLGVVGYLTAAVFLHGHYVRPFWLLLGLLVAAAHIARHEEPVLSRGERA